MEGWGGEELLFEVVVEVCCHGVERGTGGPCRGL